MRYYFNEEELEIILFFPPTPLQCICNGYIVYYHKFIYAKIELFKIGLCEFNSCVSISSEGGKLKSYSNQSKLSHCWIFLTEDWRGFNIDNIRKSKKCLKLEKWNHVIVQCCSLISLSFLVSSNNLKCSHQIMNPKK